MSVLAVHPFLDNQTLNVAALILVLIAAIPANVFPVLYSFRPWTTTAIGRGLMISSVGMALLIDVTLAFYLFGDYPGRDIIRLIVFGIITIGLYFETYSLIKSGREYNSPKEPTQHD